jgi:hypothetical protein
VQGPIDPFPTGLPERPQPKTLSTMLIPGAIDSLRQAQLHFNTLSFRAKGTVTVDDSGNDATITVRIDRDKAIWASVTATIAQVEIARILLTPDSVKIINRAMEQYLVKPFGYIQKYTGSGTSFGMVQALLTGSALPGAPDGAAVERRDGNVLFSGKLESLIYLLTTTPEFRISRTDLKNEQTAQLLNASYSGFSLLDGQPVPGSVSIRSSAAGGKVSADLEYSKLVLNEPVETPFSIPRRFKQID